MEAAAGMDRNRILYWLILLFFITIYFPFSPVVNNIAMALLFGYCLFFYNHFSEKRKLLKQRKVIVALLLFGLLHIISCFLSTDRQEALEMLAMRSPILLFPLTLGLITIPTQLKQRLLWSYSLITLLAAVVCLCYGIIAFRQTGDSGVLYNDSLTEVIHMQSIYFAMLVNIAIVSLAWLLHQKSPYIKYPGLVYTAILFFLLIHFMLASRIAIGILYTSLLLFAGYTIFTKKKLLEGITLLLGLLIGIFLLVKFFPKTINRFRELEYREYNYKNNAAESHYNGELTKDQWNGANIRLAVWNCAWDLFKKRPVAGWQLGDKQQMLEKEYISKNFLAGSKKNTHNNYLDVLITFGIIGLALFITAYILLPLITCYKAGNYICIFIIAAFAISLLTENYLDRSLGNVLLNFFVCFMVAASAIPVRD